MEAAWPWFAVAAFGALHGLNPLSGWPAVAACGGRHDGRGPVRRALVSLAVGHLLSVLLVLAWRWTVRRSVAMPAGGLTQAALGLWSFIVSTVQGAGLMLVPALAPLCLSGLPDRAAGSAGASGLALAAAGLHMAAMLGAAAAVAVAARRAARSYGAARARCAAADAPSGRRRA